MNIFYFNWRYLNVRGIFDDIKDLILILLGVIIFCLTENVFLFSRVTNLLEEG